VSASQSVLDLITIALQTVRVAFRIGAKVNAAARSLSTTPNVQANQSWARLVTDVQKKTALDEVTQFNKKKVRKIDSTLPFTIKLTS
jgi:predicted RND superfamily exporter protein